MYLQSLDHCDYYRNPNTAINQLVQSVKEKLPVTNPSKEGHLPKGDSAYKENVILSLSLINDQIIDISQIAVNRILESNERNIMRLHDIQEHSRQTQLPGMFFINTRYLKFVFLI